MNTIHFHSAQIRPAEGYFSTKFQSKHTFNFQWRFSTQIFPSRHHLKHGWAHQIKCKHFLFPAPKKIQDILLYCQRFSSLALCWLVRAQPAHSRYTDLCRKKRPKHRRMLGSPRPQKKSSIDKQNQLCENLFDFLVQGTRAHFSKF